MKRTWSKPIQLGLSSPNPSTTSAFLSQDILEEIFLNLPPHQVVHCCRLVCHVWKDVVDQNAFWRRRCRKEGYHVGEAHKIPDNWMLFYFLSKKRRNLIRNPRGEDGMTHWRVLKNGGDGWAVVSLPNKHPDETIHKTFATSFYMCEKAQMIDLEREGYKPEFMDRFQPDIRISDWFISRWDCGSKYDIRVELLNQEMKLIKYFAPNTVIVHAGASRHWNQMTHIFQNYGPGVRYIHFIHGGIDIRYWKGHFGIHVTEACVEICPAMQKMIGTGFGRTDKDQQRKATSRLCTIS